MSGPRWRRRPPTSSGRGAARWLVGRAAIRAGIVAYQDDPPGTVDFEGSGHVLHETTDPDVFSTEIDTVLDRPDGGRMSMSFVQIFRVRDGLITSMRDYFRPPPW